MVMKDGHVVEHDNTDELLRQPRHEYTRRLIGAEPKGAVATA
jgi:ABC-type microcin C transport system duplicated ATPase subunit YejF